MEGTNKGGGGHVVKEGGVKGNGNTIDSFSKYNLISTPSSFLALPFSHSLSGSLVRRKGKV